MSLSEKILRPMHGAEEKKHPETSQELERKYRLRELEYKGRLLREQFKENAYKLEILESKLQGELDKIEALKEEKANILREEQALKESTSEDYSDEKEEDEDFTEQLYYLKAYAEDAVKYCHNVTEYYVDGKSLHLKIVYPDGLYRSVITFRKNGCYSYSTTKIQDSTTGDVARNIQRMLFGRHDIIPKEEWISLSREKESTEYTEEKGVN